MWSADNRAFRKCRDKNDERSSRPLLSETLVSEPGLLRLENQTSRIDMGVSQRWCLRDGEWDKVRTLRGVSRHRLSRILAGSALDVLAERAEDLHALLVGEHAGERTVLP